MTTQKFDVFISYANGDTRWAQSLAKSLEKNGLSVWWREPGQVYPAIASETREALRNSRLFVVLFGKNSSGSPGINFLLGAALERGMEIVPVVSKDLPVDRLPAMLSKLVEEQKLGGGAPLVMEEPEDVAARLRIRVVAG
ncbi:MAG: toll/interleukin-1 receptor domain-containing protein [Chloroflexi bacterium]|nr:toll/interleukin-1 receptor domain-containing protein [Chloroflexota bacterium]